MNRNGTMEMELEREINAQTIPEENRKFYAQEAEYYDTIHPEVWNWNEQRRCRRLVRKTQAILGKGQSIIVDVGAGTGNLTLKYLKAGSTVISIDVSSEMLEKLNRKLTGEEKKRSRSICGDIALELEKLETVDGICFSSVLHHLYDYNAVVTRSLEKLRKGGIILIIHEPIFQEPRSKLKFKLHRLIGRLDESIYRKRMRSKGYKPDDFPDDTLAEFHQNTGTFKYKELIELIEGAGIRTKYLKTYVSRRYGWMSWGATNLVRSENTFAYIGVKRD